MPVLTRWMVKTALLYFVLALITGAFIGIRQWYSPGWLPAGLTPVYIHLYMVGWVTLLIFGVVYWMFPKYSKDSLRGSERVGWAVYWLLNIGLILRAVAESQARPGSAWGWVLVVSAVLQLLAGIGFVFNTWPRVKEK